MMMIPPRHAWIKRPLMLGLVTIVSSFIASILLVGCGENSANPPYNEDVAKKASAKYKELFPDQFPGSKKKVTKARRGR
jgi:hypothetical protein